MSIYTDLFAMKIQFNSAIFSAEAVRTPNGAVTLVGDVEVLTALREYVEKHAQIFLTMDLSYKIEGVEQPGYPRITVHPQVVDRVLDKIDGLVLCPPGVKETPEQRSHRLYQQHGADVLTKAKQHLRTAFELVGIPDALDLLASAQRDAMERYVTRDPDVARVTNERYDALIALAAKLR